MDKEKMRELNNNVIREISRGDHEAAAFYASELTRVVSNRLHQRNTYKKERDTKWMEKTLIGLSVHKK